MPNPSNESQRLRALQALRVVGSTAEPVFDSVVSLLAQVTNTPIALISLVTEDQQWFKAKVDLPQVRSTARDISFCTHAIEGRGIMVVSDASRDNRFSSNPLVTESPGIRFYAGASLVTSDGYALGTLCAIDRVPRTLTTEQLTMLRQLAIVVTALIEARSDKVQLSEARAALALMH